jgi:hypothetical protein
MRWDFRDNMATLGQFIFTGIWSAFPSSGGNMESNRLAPFWLGDGCAHAGATA